jgi:hypothetical protein
MATAAPVPLIDELMPRFDEFERHAIRVPAPPAGVYPALRRVDLLGSRLIRWLLFVRSMPSVLSRPRDGRPPAWWGRSAGSSAWPCCGPWSARLLDERHLRLGVGELALHEGVVDV